MALWTADPQRRRVNDIEELRAHFAALFARFGAPPPDDGVRARASSARSRANGCRPRASTPGRAILYFHGGGFVAGSPETHRALVGRLAEASEAEAFAVALPAGAGMLFPARGARRHRRLSRAAGSGRSTPASVVLAGDGAGGGLAFAVALAIRNAGPADARRASRRCRPGPICRCRAGRCWPTSKSDAALDWELLFHARGIICANPIRADAYASPVFANLKDFPPVMVHAGAAEILRDDASKLGDRAAEAQTPVSVEIYDGMGHLFQADTRRATKPRSRWRGWAQFIRSQTQRQRSGSLPRAAPKRPVRLDAARRDLAPEPLRRIASAAWRRKVPRLVISVSRRSASPRLA